MKIFYVSKVRSTNELKMEPTENASSKIQTIYADRILKSKDFKSINNIIHIDSDGPTDYEVLFNRLMRKQSFGIDNLANSLEIYRAYEEYNKEYASKINDICNSNDFIIINDSSLLLLPLLCKCKCAIRNLTFDSFFITRLPFSECIMDSLLKADKFFQTLADYRAFQTYIETSYEFRNVNVGGCHYIEPFVDKMEVLEILEEFQRVLFFNNIVNTNNALSSYIKKAINDSDSISIVCDGDLLMLEPAIRNDPSIKIKYCSLDLDFNVNNGRMCQYLRQTYNANIEILSNQWEVIVNMILCKAYAGTENVPLARLFGKECGPAGNGKKLARIIEEKIRESAFTKPNPCVFGEEEYIAKFVRVCGFEVIQEYDAEKINSRIAELITIINLKLNENERIADKITNLNITADLNESSGECEARYNSSTECENCECKDDFECKCENLNQENFECKCENLNQENFECKCDNFNQENFDEFVDFSNETVSELQAENDHVMVCTNSKKSRKNTTAATRIQIFEYENKCDENVCNLNKEKKDSKKNNSISKEEFKELYKKTNGKILIDYDGTLSEIQPRPEMAVPSKSLLDFLKRKPEIAICTGRSVNQVDEWFPAEIEIFAEHGARHRINGKWDDVKEKKVYFRSACRDIMNYYQKRTPNSTLEEKSCGLAFHYRLCEDFDKTVKMMYSELKKLSLVLGFLVTAGKKVIEVKLGNKGKIVDKREPGMVCGDDLTDEDMFEHSKSLTVKVGEEKTKADYFVRNPKEMIKLLEYLTEK